MARTICEVCGCETANKHPDHEHAHLHTKTVTLEQKVLVKNDALADQNRAWLAEVLGGDLPACR